MDLKSKIFYFLDNFNATEINEYFANDFIDDREEYFDKKERGCILDYLNDSFIDIDINFRDSDNFEKLVRDTLETALKMFKIDDINECDRIKTKDGRVGTVMAIWFDTTGLEVEFDDNAPITETIDVVDVQEIINK
jgi:hypothetical protein